MRNTDVTYDMVAGNCRNDHINISFNLRKLCIIIQNVFICSNLCSRMHLQQPAMAPNQNVITGGYDSDVEGGNPYGDNNAGFETFSDKAVSS